MILLVGLVRPYTAICPNFHDIHASNNQFIRLCKSCTILCFSHSRIEQGAALNGSLWNVSTLPYTCNWEHCLLLPLIVSELYSNRIFPAINQFPYSMLFVNGIKEQPSAQPVTTLKYRLAVSLQCGHTFIAWGWTVRSPKHGQLSGVKIVLPRSGLNSTIASTRSSSHSRFLQVRTKSQSCISRLIIYLFPLPLTVTSVRLSSVPTWDSPIPYRPAEA